MAPGLQILVPTVSLTKSQQTSQASSPASSLNPVAPAFEPKLANSLSAVAQDFVPSKTNGKLAPRSPFDDLTDLKAITGKMEVLDFDEIEASPPPDLTDPTKQTILEGVNYIADSDTFVFTCNTHDALMSTQGHAAVVELATGMRFPHKAQLNIFTGPRVQQVHKAAQWFVESLGPYMRAVQKVHVVIVRSGELIGTKFVIPQIDLEEFLPLKNCIAELLQVLPKHADILWGASDDLSLILRKHYLARAVPDEQAVFAEEEDKGVKKYSECISSATLKNIAAHYSQLKGKKTYPILDPRASTATYINTPTLTYDRSRASSRASNLNPNAAPFIPKLDPGAQEFVPPSVHMTTEQHFDPRDHFHKQLYEVEASRNGWVPPIYDYGVQYDVSHQYTRDLHNSRGNMAPIASYPSHISTSMNQMAVGTNMHHVYDNVYGLSAQFQYRSGPYFDFAAGPSTCGAPAVWATIPQHAQQQTKGFGKKGKKKENKNGDRQRQYYQEYSDHNEAEHQRYLQNNYGVHDNNFGHGYGNSYGNGYGNSYGNGNGNGAGNEYGAYLSAYAPSHAAPNTSGHSNGAASGFGSGHMNGNGHPNAFTGRTFKKKPKKSKNKAKPTSPTRPSFTTPNLPDELRGRPRNRRLNPPFNAQAQAQDTYLPPPANFVPGFDMSGMGISGYSGAKIDMGNMGGMGKGEAAHIEGRAQIGEEQPLEYVIDDSVDKANKPVPFEAPMTEW